MLDEHLGYVADHVRNRLYREAIARVVKPGDVVVDLGCGSGVLGLACLEAGASRLIAIDSTQMIEVARETFARAGYGDRCDLIRGRSYRVTTGHPADVVVCDHVGYLGFDYGVVELLRDARERFLKPQGKVLPGRIRLYLAPIQSARLRAKVDGWRGANVVAAYHWLGAYGANTKHPVELKGDEVIGAPVLLGEIDLSDEKRQFFSWTADLTVDRDAVLHGVAGWFECEIADGVWMTNSPVATAPIDRPQALLPIGEPIPVNAGERIKATLLARPADSLLAWSVEIPSAGRRFDHSTWNGLILGANDLLRTNPSRVPRPSAMTRARGIVLGYCDGRRSAREIEELVLRDHPDLFPVRSEISHFVAEVLSRDTE